MRTELPAVRIELRYEDRVRDANTALRRALAELEGCFGRVLETGCGTGRFLRALQRHRPDLEYLGFDIVPETLKVAKGMSSGIWYSLASLTHIPFAAAQFDGVVLFDVLEHLPDPPLALGEIHRVLKPGGRLHALVPCEGQPFTLHWLLWKLNLGADLKERHGGHVQRFSHASLRSLLGAQGFQGIKVTYSMHPLGQVKDILTYLERETWFHRYRLDGLPYRLLMKLLWVLAYLEAQLLARVPLSAVALHVTAYKPR